MSKETGSLRMTKQEGKEYLARWLMVNEYEIRLLRAMTPDQQVDAFCREVQFARAVGWQPDESDAEEVLRLRERWNKLRRKYLERQQVEQRDKPTSADVAEADG